MKIRCIFLLIMFSMTCLLVAQLTPVTPLPGTRSAAEKIYKVKQLYGKDYQELQAKNKIEYNRNGLPTIKYLYLFNDTYQGKILYQQGADANTQEELEYNAMNDLIETRRMQHGSTSVDYVYTRFSGKGVIVEKIQSVRDSVSNKRTESVYKELGYMISHSIYELDTQLRDKVRHFYDYDDYNTLNAYYSYDDAGLISEMKEYSENDSLMNHVVYHYSPTGKLLGVNYYHINEQQYKREFYQYDDKDRLIEYRRYETTPSFGGIEKLAEIRQYKYKD